MTTPQGVGTTGASASSSSMSMTSTARPPFPEPGSLLGTEGRYFTLTRLGRGTFCSIHKCVDLAYFHASSTKRRRHRVVAAKVELSTFCGSGVLDGEATILRHLSECQGYPVVSQVPQFLHYVRDIPGGSAQDAGTVIDDQTGKPFVAGAPTTSMTAIVMEYLSGEDMHQLRDRHCQAVAAAAAAASGGPAKPSSAVPPSRRIAIADAVYLVADVMLPLLESMHHVGVIHRDVKPSNCVRVATESHNRKFKMVDFGLSKSFVVPTDSPQANRECPWTWETREEHEGQEEGEMTSTTSTVHRPWYAPPLVMAALNPPDAPETKEGEDGNNNDKNNNDKKELPKLKYPKGSLRQERKDAEFRGTSMYASLRVHQGRDYCRRDDLWGLLYVFCDLVSGGLPWMAYAAAKDRNMCRLIKEVVHGERRENSIALDAQGRGCVVDGERQEETTEVPKDHVEWLLMGADYHLSKHKRDVVVSSSSRSDNNNNKSSSSSRSDNNNNKSSSSSPPPLAEPLRMSRDAAKVDLLRTAFDHVSSLSFTDEPNYALLRKCLRQFLVSSSDEGDDVPLIDWTQTAPAAAAAAATVSTPNKKRRRSASSSRKRRETPIFELENHPPEQMDPLQAKDWDEIEEERYLAAATEAAHFGMSAASSMMPLSPATLKAAAAQPDMANLARLPLELQLRLAQVEYHATHSHSVPPHVALRDWMALAQLLLHDKWDSRHWERWGSTPSSSLSLSSKRRRGSRNESESDQSEDEDGGGGHRREVYMKMVNKCLEAAKPFGYFCQPSCLFTSLTEWTRREISLDPLSKKPRSALLEVSKAIVGLRVALEEERVKKFKPLPTISFSSIKDEDEDDHVEDHTNAAAPPSTMVA